MKLIACVLLLFFAYDYCYSQKIDSTINNIESVPDKFFSKVDKKISFIDKLLAKKSAKYLAKTQKLEDKMLKKLRKINADEADKLAEGMAKKYNDLSNDIKSKTQNADQKAGEYNPYIDTLGTSLSYLNANNSAGKAAAPLADLKQLEGRLQQSEKVKQFIDQRKQLLTEALSKYTTYVGIDDMPFGPQIGEFITNIYEATETYKSLNEFYFP
jgi:hypothetical protein